MQDKTNKITTKPYAACMNELESVLQKMNSTTYKHKFNTQYASLILFFKYFRNKTHQYIIINPIAQRTNIYETTCNSNNDTTINGNIEHESTVSCNST